MTNAENCLNNVREAIKTVTSGDIYDSKGYLNGKGYKALEELEGLDLFWVCDPLIKLVNNAKKEDCGKWIFHKDFHESIRYGCNQCGNLTNIPSNFCPNCGKRMLKGAHYVKE